MNLLGKKAISRRAPAMRDVTFKRRHFLKLTAIQRLPRVLR